MGKINRFTIFLTLRNWSRLLFIRSTILTLLFIFCSQINASILSQQRVTLKLNDATIIKLLKEIEGQTELGFLYNLDDVKNISNISIDADNMLVEEVLNKVLSDFDLTYEIDKNVIIIKAVPQETQPENENKITISGKVTNDNGESLPGATVVDIETRMGISTDKNGNFKITVPDKKSVLRISFVGYTTVEVPVGDSKFLDIVLKAKTSDINEVVVTGIFNRQKESYTGSASSISAEELQRVGSVNVFQALKNLDPTMTFVDNFEAGSNPSTMPEIQIRGTSSLDLENNTVNSKLKGNYLKDPNQPLFIVDGFEASQEQIFDMDMDRIQSITILKDAAAKAIYGSKSANGVVVIETKKLETDETRVTFKTSLNIEMPDLSSYNLCNAEEKLEAEVIDGMYLPDNKDAENYVELLQLYNSRKEKVLQGLDTYWLAKPLQTGIGQKHSLTVEMGGGNMKVMTGLTYNDVVGVMKGSSRTNISGFANISYRVNKLLFKNYATVVNNKSSESPYGEFSDYAKMNPYWKSQNADGTIPYYAEIGPNGEKYLNPLFNSTLNSKNVSSYLNFIDNFYLEWYVLDGLKTTTRIGIDTKRSDADEFYPAAHTMFENVEDQRKGSYQVNNGKSTNISGDFNANYSKYINKHFLFANIGFNIGENQYMEVIHSVEGFPSDQMNSIFFGRSYALDATPTGAQGLTREMGFLGVFSYMYNNKYLTDLTLRSNASSLFGADKRWAKFWSLGVAWNAHNESFLQNGPFKQLKIRASMGSTGNQNFNTNTSVSTYSYYLDAFYQGYIGSYLQNLANPNLQWESKFEYNAGADIAIKNLSLSFDYYLSYTENLITDITIPTSNGFSSVKENIGRVKNSGLELKGSYLIWSSGQNFLNCTASIATNKNVISKLSDAMKSYNEKADEEATDKFTNTPVHKYEDGISLNAIWAVPSLGIDPANGKEIYVDRDGNTTYTWNANNMIVCGNSSPDYQGNFSINGEYKGVGFTIASRYFGGGQYYNQTLLDKVENVDINYNVDKRVLSGRWRYPGQVTSFKKLGEISVDTDGDGVYETQGYEKTRATSRFVQDYDELDISAISLYYEFSNSFINKLNIGLERLKFAANMNDVARISSIRAERGTSYPFARTLTCSLSATF